ncbi:MAG: type I-G CRISPR-associated protein, Cas3-extension family [Streptosporangiaceae bacterium]
MTHAVDLPALDGRSPLGFLATLGLLNLLSDTPAKPVGLSFSSGNGTAVIHSSMSSLDEVEQELAAIAAAAVDDAAIAGVDPRFPLRPGAHADPMRRPRGNYRELAAEIRNLDARAADYWLPHLLTDLAVDNAGRAALTPYTAPSGKQNLRTFFSRPLEQVRANPSRIHEALAGWRRVEGFTGEYLDHHVLNSAADDPLGRTAAEKGVPGATWLATMALPVLRITGDGENVAATLWYRTERRPVMIWPLWRQQLGLLAIQALIEHPCLMPVDPAPTVLRKDWAALGIFGVYGAERQPIPRRKFPGVLSPIAIAATG